jgi:hypothetical protein
MAKRSRWGKLKLSNRSSIVLAGVGGVFAVSLLLNTVVPSDSQVAAAGWSKNPKGTAEESCKPGFDYHIELQKNGALKIRREVRNDHQLGYVYFNLSGGKKLKGIPCQDTPSASLDKIQKSLAQTGTRENLDVAASLAERPTWVAPSNLQFEPSNDSTDSGSTKTPGSPSILCTIGKFFGGSCDPMLQKINYVPMAGDSASSREVTLIEELKARQELGLTESAGEQAQRQQADIANEQKTIKIISDTFGNSSNTSSPSPSWFAKTACGLFGVDCSSMPPPETPVPPTWFACRILCLGFIGTCEAAKRQGCR